MSHFFNKQRITFWSINFLLAIFIVIVIGYFVIKRLERYTQHGYYIVVPDFRGLRPENAATLAQSQHLQTVIIDSVHDNDALPGVVVEQFPSPNAQVKSSRIIQITINANKPEKIILPNLKNVSFRQTIQRLKNLGLHIGRLEYIPSNFKNLVLNLTHNNIPLTAGDSLYKGDTVNIVLGDGNGENNQVVLPDLRGKTLEEAKNILLQSFLNLGDIIPDETISHPNDHSSALIYQQTPEIDTIQRTVKLGEAISIYLTKDIQKLAALDSLNTNNQQKDDNGN